MAKRGEARAFFEDAKSSETDACIIWPFSKKRNGYGDIRSENGRSMVYVHREMCRFHNGQPASDDLEAAHMCGVRACINKRHLRWDTHKGNHSDRIKHGTSNRGSSNGQARLSEAQVLEIRSKASAGEDCRLLSAEYGTSYSNIRSIASGSTWAWL